MKLDTKRTVLIGFGFMSILAFWQFYDQVIPHLLENVFGLRTFTTNAIMSIDNVSSLVLLPLFGTLSDKHNGKSGRRTPFIRFGTAIAAMALVALSFVDNMQLDLIRDISTVDDPAALSVIYDTQADKELQTPSGTKFVLSDKFSKEDFTAIRSPQQDRNCISLFKQL